MKYSTQELAKSIKIARNKKGLSQRALSIKIGVPQGHISRIENGLVDLQTSSLIEIARALDLELMLVSRSFVPAVQAIQSNQDRSNSLPAYQLTEEEDDT